LKLDTPQAALQWATSYKRATRLQAPLALISFLSGVAVSVVGGGVPWLLPALAIGAVVPFTFVSIMPTNRRLLATDRDLSGDSTRDLLVKWGELHAVRTVLSLVAAGIYIWDLVEV